MKTCTVATLLPGLLGLLAAQRALAEEDVTAGMASANISRHDLADNQLAQCQAEYGDYAFETTIKTMGEFISAPIQPIKRTLLRHQLGQLDLAPAALDWNSMGLANAEGVFYHQMLDAGRELDMIYAGDEAGHFWGYFASLAMTYRSSGTSQATAMSWAPYALDDVNAAVDAGTVRGAGGSFVAADCAAVPADDPFLARGDTCVDAGIRSYYSADDKGPPTGFTRWRVYDHRARPWYQQAKAAWTADPERTVLWSDVYVFADGAPGISAMGVVTDAAGDFAAVLAVDYKLSSVDRFLAAEFGSSGLMAYVLERSGKLLLGTSTGSALVDPADNRRLTAMQSPERLVAATAARLEEGGWEWTASSLSSTPSSAATSATTTA